MSNLRFPIAWLETACTGRWLNQPPAGVAHATGFSIDTRSLQTGQVYIAIRGERFDGHQFVGQAVTDHGAAFAIADEQATEWLDPAWPVWVVPDTVAALQELATAHRERLATGGCRVVGIVGSNGKTTTRALVHHALTRLGLTGTQSPKSFNNHLGVPLTLLAADPSHDFVAAEIGTNHPGEIDALGQIAQPDVAVLTSIGHEHLEAFRDLDGVAREEAAIAPHIKNQGGLVLHSDALTWLERVGTDLDHVRLHLADALVHHPTIASQEFPLPGAHNQQNAALVLVLAQLMGLPTQGPAVAHLWEGFQAPDGRMVVLTLGQPGQTITVLNDAYNANPSSMAASLSILESWAPRPRKSDQAATDQTSDSRPRRVAVLGQMNELGPDSPSHHANTQALALRSADLVLAVGRDYPNDSPATLADDLTDAAIQTIVDALEPGDVVLLKASRGQRLERLLPAIEQRFPSTPLNNASTNHPIAPK